MFQMQLIQQQTYFNLGLSFRSNLAGREESKVGNERTTFTVFFGMKMPRFPVKLPRMKGQQETGGHVFSAPSSFYSQVCSGNHFRAQGPMQHCSLLHLPLFTFDFTNASLE